MAEGVIVTALDPWFEPCSREADSRTVTSHCAAGRASPFCRRRGAWARLLSSRSWVTLWTAPVLFSSQRAFVLFRFTHSVRSTASFPKTVPSARTPRGAVQPGPSCSARGRARKKGVPVPVPSGYSSQSRVPFWSSSWRPRVSRATGMLVGVTGRTETPLSAISSVATPSECDTILKMLGTPVLLDGTVAPVTHCSCSTKTQSSTVAARSINRQPQRVAHAHSSS